MGELRIRSPEEVRAYVDGYNAAYKQFCECLKGRKSILDAIRKMEILVAAVNGVVNDGLID
ncbi:MAG: hypothetical protein J6S14_02220 [Clostridia bacterium]|nr:hypothetical protein [Clostridia bacterium]